MVHANSSMSHLVQFYKKAEFWDLAEFSYGDNSTSHSWNRKQCILINSNKFQLIQINFNESQLGSVHSDLSASKHDPA